MQDFERWLPFTPMQPTALGVPDAVYLRVLETGQFVGVSAWNPTEALPEASETGFGAILMQFTAPSEATYLLKTLDLRVSSVTKTTVAGNDGYWVEGVFSLTIFGPDGSESPSLRKRAHLATERHRIPSRNLTIDDRGHCHR